MDSENGVDAKCLRGADNEVHNDFAKTQWSLCEFIVIDEKSGVSWSVSVIQGDLIINSY